MIVEDTGCYEACGSGGGGGGNGTTPAPTCDAANVAMTAPATVSVCGSVPLGMSGTEGDTWTNDVISGGMPNGIVCPDTKLWPGFTCTAKKPGTYTWTHKWKKCEGGTTNCSNECSKSVTVTVQAPQFSLWVNTTYVPFLFSRTGPVSAVDMNCDGKGNWSDYEILRKGFTI